MAIGQQLLNVPMGDMIRQMAFAIADAQLELDESSVRVAELMSGQRPLRDAEGNLVDQDGNPTDVPEYVDTRVYFGHETVEGVEKPARVSMMELGFTPTFYQFIDTIIEVKIAIKITRDTEFKTNWTARQETRKNVSCSENTVQTSQVDASYSAKYGYTAEGSSLLRTKLVPVPPPAILEERIRGLLDAERTPPAPAPAPN